jgi:hypothetical protein
MVQLTASSSLNFLNSLIVCLRDYFCNVPQRWRRETRVFCSTPGTAASPDRVVRRRREACRYLYYRELESCFFARKFDHGFG